MRKQEFSKQIFSKRLREAFEKTGVTWQEVCKQTGITDSVIRKYIREESVPSVHRAFKLARFLGVSLEWLVGFGKEQS